MPDTTLTLEPDLPQSDQDRIWKGLRDFTESVRQIRSRKCFATQSLRKNRIGGRNRPPREISTAGHPFAGRCSLTNRFFLKLSVLENQPPGHQRLGLHKIFAKP